MPKTLLFIDDDDRIQELLRIYFEKNNYRLLSALTGMQGLDLLKQAQTAVDIIVLDLMLPEIDGFETLREIRKISDVPVIMLTAKDDETDRIVGLEIGADDYLHKPINPRELLARIKAVLRRTQRPGAPETPSAQTAEEIHCLGITINPATRRVLRQGEEIILSTVEFELLLALISSKGRVITRDQLMNLARGRDFEAFDRSIDVHISRIRKKIEPDPANPRYIKTIWGVGYMWAAER